MSMRTNQYFAFLASGLLTCVASAPAYAEQAVVMTGVQVDFGDRVNRDPGSPFGMDSGYTIDDICTGVQDPRFGPALRDMLNVLESEMANAGAPFTLSQIESMPGAPNRFDIERDLANTRDAVCERREPEITVQPFTISYSSCRMSMFTPTHAMVLSMPSDGGNAIMLAADHPNRNVIHIELTSNIDAVSQVLGSGWNDGVEMTPTDASQDIFGYESDQYNFSYTTGLGETSLGALTEADVQGGAIDSPFALGNLVSVETKGTAWISDSAPGIDIVKTFYRNLATRFQAGEANSFFGGMINNLVAMLDKGIPIIIDQTVSSKVMGRTSISGRSESHVANIRLIEVAPDWCDKAVQAPENYETTDLNAMMQGSNAGGGDAPSSDEMAAAMQEAREAMNSMTPEQRQAMEQYGLGDMMSQMMGGADAGGQTAAAATTAQAASGSAGSNMPPAEELQSGNMTESVQKHLQALGYDVGATNGEMSMETTIAISTFQAEKGMDVTGEVTPQLLGVLSAEVDSRR